ncbi:hypothetical protein BSK64_06205 [Paenibacillus odorifer]|uniref:acyltransferase family protein n=1 Tax=Paenibacillus odorifer TaxID=189426 RepID=UPI00096F3A7F|nr:acyltransferase [Paenibacillus odorifer]OME07846.1 hypothetical protein BSK64_06205 [Paenibacillus odorifer]
MHKLKFIDGLRGVAALIVVLNHFAVGFYPALYNGDINQVHTQSNLELIIAKSPLNLIYNGSFAVCIFFLLSGYVLSYKYFNTKKIDVLVESAVKRYFRLLTPVLASIVLAFLLMKFSLFYNKEAGTLSFSTWWLSTFWDFDASIIDVVKNAFFGVFFNNDGKYNAVLWTMTYELFGSFIVFGFAALFGRVRRRYLFYIIAIILTYNTYYLGFILGMILSDINIGGYFNKSFFRNFFFKMILMVIGLYLASYPSAATVNNSIYKSIEATDPKTIVLYHTLGAFCIILVLLNSVKFQTIFSTKVFEFFGKISFSMYLLHLLVIGSLSSYIFITLIDHVSYSIAVMISLFITLPILLTLSYLMYKHVDKNGIKLANSIFNRFFKNNSQ